MISVEEALEIICNYRRDLGEVRIPFADAVGRTLVQPILADRDFPPFHRATMDGIALSSMNWNAGQRSFPITGEQFAGAPKQRLKPGTCVEIMTGAVVPDGADLVIRYEDTNIENGVATVHFKEAKDWMNVHLQGTDAKKDHVLIEARKTITYGDVGVLTSVGKVEVLVKKLPKVAIISTGDELVEPDETPLLHQIRKSNVHTLCTLLKKEGVEFQAFHLNDVWEEITVELKQILTSFDLVIMSGGVSMGKRDYVPNALKSLGVEQHFHKVMQRPGKPLWFGSNNTATVFGLPGNPVSTLVCYLVYCRHWIKEQRHSFAQLTQEVRFEKDLTYFIPVAISNEDGMQLATPFPGHGSGDLVNLSHADGFLEMSRGKDVFRKGEVYRVRLF